MFPFSDTFNTCPVKGNLVLLLLGMGFYKSNLLVNILKGAPQRPLCHSNTSFLQF